MSYAINYSYILEELRQGVAIRAYSPISPGFGAPYNASVEAIAPDYNLTKARFILQSMGYGVGFNVNADAEWISVAESGNPFLSVPDIYNVGNQFREDLYIALHGWFKLIGIEIVDSACVWMEFLNYLFDDYDHLGVFAIGLGPDYLDPFNLLEPLFGPNSSSNSAQVKDATLNAMMELALETTNDEARNDIYKNIQSLMVNEGYFHAPMYHSKIIYVHLANLYNVPYNAMQRFEAYGIYRSLYPM